MALQFPAWGDEPAEIVRRTKAALALIEAQPGSYFGTAFCIDSSGLFATNRKLVPGTVGKSITLRMNPDSPEQKLIKATVVRIDTDTDLMLLQADGTDFPFLPLGDSEKLFESMPVITVGYPRNKPVVDRNTYPSPMLISTTVTSLRIVDGRLSTILIGTDRDTNSSIRGGPIIDANGRVVGILDYSSGWRFARPVNSLKALLDEPLIAFPTTMLDERASREERRFNVKVISFRKPAEDRKVELEFQSGTAEPRRFVAQPGRDGTYHVVASLVPDEPGPLQVQVEAEFAEGTLRGRVADRMVRVGAETVPLSQIWRIERDATGEAVEVALDGKVLTGVLGGLDDATVDFGGVTAKVNLSKSQRMNVTPVARTPSEVLYRVVVREGGATLGELNGRIAITPSPPDFVDALNPANVESAPEGERRGRHISLGTTPNLPQPWTISSGFLIDDDGGIRMKHKELAITRSGNYLTQDFTYEVVLALKATDGIAIIGLGDAVPGGLNDPSEAARMRIHPPGLSNGEVYLSKNQTTVNVFCKMPRPGTHLFRIEKTGNAVTFSVDVDNDGPTPDDGKYEIPDITAFAPFLHEKNTFLFFGAGGLFQSVALSERPINPANRAETVKAARSRAVKLTEQAAAGYALKEARIGAQIWNDRDYTFTALPDEVAGGTFLVRDTEATKQWLEPGIVSALTDCRVYALFRVKDRDQVLVDEATFAKLSREGWREVAGVVKTTRGGGNWQWAAWRKNVSQGEVDMLLKTITWGQREVVFVFNNQPGYPRADGRATAAEGNSGTPESNQRLPSRPFQSTVLEFTEKAAPNLTFQAARLGTPVWTDKGYLLAALPPEIVGGTVVWRDSGSEGWFPARCVRATRDCTVYAIVRWKYLDKMEIDEATFTKFAKEGWKEAGEVKTTFPNGEDWRWKALSKKVSAGEVSLPLDSINWGQRAVLFVFK
jgi:hypothetical protein